MEWIFNFISCLYVYILKKSPHTYFDSITLYEKAFREFIAKVNEKEITCLDIIDNLHLYCEQYLKLKNFEIPKWYSTDSPKKGEEVSILFINSLLTELGGNKTYFEILSSPKVMNSLKNDELIVMLQQKFNLIKSNSAFQDVFFNSFEKFNSLSNINGMSKRDLYIPLYGKYTKKLNNTYFPLESEIHKFCQDKTKNNILFLFGDAGQGKSTFVRTYFCEHFFEKQNIFLFKLTNLFPLIYSQNEINMQPFLNHYGISSDLLQNGLIILDGLDEVLGELPTIPLSLTNFISSLEDAFYLLAPSCKILITSRPQDIKDKLIGYEGISISELNYYEQKKWIIKYSTMSGNKDFTLNDLQEIRNNSKELTSLIKTPLLFEIIVSQNFKYRIGNRVVLFEKLFNETINTIRSPRTVHKLFEKFAYEEFFYGVNASIPTEQTKYLYHQSFLEFYYKPGNSVGVEFVHRSFYQHFLAYYLVNSFIESIATVETLSSFLKGLGTRRLDALELENIKWIVEKEAVYLYPMQIELVFDEIVRHNCIYHEEENSLLKANTIFVNCINLVNSMVKDTIQLTPTQKKTFNYLLKIFDNFGIQLTKFNLSYYSLVGAKLTNADLEGINMSGCDLARVDLSCANLSNADISGSYLRGADIRGANMQGADLSESNLSNSYLSGSNMKDCNLTKAYLINGNLLAVDLTGAILKYANMQGAILNEAIYSNEQLKSALRTKEQLIAYLNEVRK